MAEPKKIKPLAQGRPTAPLLVCIGGLPGTGKTTVGLALLGHMPTDTVFVCPDRTMLRLLGKPEGSAIESGDITPAIHAAAVADMKDRTRQALAAGHSVVVPSAFVGQAMRQAFEAIAAETGAGFRPFWLDAPVPVLHGRAIRRQEAARDPKTAFNASAVGTDKIRPDLVEGPVTWPHIDAGQSPAEVLNAILEKLQLQGYPASSKPDVSPA